MSLLGIFLFLLSSLQVFALLHVSQAASMRYTETKAACRS
nr:MAG TPA: hypothetical protein [Caudoviricetes sp.]